MPSPFPGMDPYLEGAEWTSVHAALGAEIARQLAPKVSPNYIVRPVRRFVMDLPDEIAVTRTQRAAYPDVGIHTIQEEAAAYAAAPQTAVAPLPLYIPTVMAEKVPVLSIEIRDVVERELITALEILSPVNKRGQGYKEYLEKRTRILSSFTHLLEIDLLRKGKRVPMQAPLPDAPYFIFLSRAPQRPICEVWPIHLHQQLPTIPVPLAPPDADVELDLQQALDAVYDIYRYDLSIDYTRPPDPSLTDEEAAWVAARLTAAGLRKA